ncbi:hypothetical protein CANMA_000078 [Candida margitis]|uniref:uncharacterized protein n=1 Tax=Candida margitis TaxID=1775924 RepID=UPI0022272E74|nr:uncharacterized protein CANMA_000078 [Candida margitis]KAI5970918.1 hypothetical protein CANMA_000078 [Candida margitis]
MPAFLRISSIPTAARHWMPVAKPQLTQLTLKQFYSSRVRFVNYNNINEISLVSNDDIINATSTSANNKEDGEVFEPTVYSSEDIHTAGPVNRA